MSNADDRCAMVGCGSVRGSIIHAIGLKSDRSSHHPFVEGPGPYCRLPFGQFEPAPQPEPSGDEAKVPSESDVWLAKVLGHGKLTDGEVDDIAHVLADFQRRAYAAGKADGAREEREACRNLAFETRCAGVSSEWDAYRLVGAIARRWSEGK